MGMAFIYVMAALIGLGVPMGLFIVYRFVRTRSESFAVSMLIWLVGIGSILVVALAQRSFGAGEIGVYQFPTALSAWTSRAFNLAAVGLAIVSILRMLPRMSIELLPAGGRPIWIALMCVFLTGVASAIWGTKPDFKHATLYSVLVLTAVYLHGNYDLRTVVRHGKIVTAIVLVASLAAVLVKPDSVLEPGYRGVIPGLGGRLHGLATHANSLGPLALLYLILEYWQPSPRLWRWINCITAIAVFVLAQSKTAWGAGVACGVVLGALAMRDRLAVALRTGRGTFVPAVVLLGGVFVSIAILIAFVFADPVYAVTRILEERMPGLATLSGRDRVWSITLALWRQNPFFGYGPGLWDLEFRMQFSPPAGHAHNQFVQTLGEAGLLGLTALAVYLLVLLRFSIKFAQATRGATVALYLLLLIRCFTEAPFRLVVFLEPAFLTHLMLFLTLIRMAQKPELRAQT